MGLDAVVAGERVLKMAYVVFEIAGGLKSMTKRDDAVGSINTGRYDGYPGTLRDMIKTVLPFNSAMAGAFGSNDEDEIRGVLTKSDDLPDQAIGAGTFHGNATAVLKESLERGTKKLSLAQKPGINSELVDKSKKEEEVPIGSMRCTNDKVFGGLRERAFDLPARETQEEGTQGTHKGR